LYPAIRLSAASVFNELICSVFKWLQLQAVCWAISSQASLTIVEKLLYAMDNEEKTKFWFQFGKCHVTCITPKFLTTLKTKPGFLNTEIDSDGR